MKTHATANTKRYQAKPRSRPSKRREVYWNWSKNGKADPTILAGIVKAVVRAAKPEKIVLFGSAARGEMGPNSDYDILVIKAGKFNFWRELTRIYKNLPGTAPVDVVLATPEVVEQYRDTHCLVYCPAMKEGKIIYDSKMFALDELSPYAAVTRYPDRIGPVTPRKYGRAVRIATAVLGWAERQVEAAVKKRGGKP